MRTRGMVASAALRTLGERRRESTPSLGWRQSHTLQSRHALVPARENLADRAQVRARRVLARPRALSLAAADRARAHLLARYLVAARGAPPPRAPGPRPDFRQIRSGALDAARPFARRHRRRARQAAGSRAAVSERTGDRDAHPRLRQACRTRLQIIRARAGRERVGGAGASRRA